MIFLVEAASRGETPEEAVTREMREETGVTPRALVPLLTFYPNPGRSAWPIHLFLAEFGRLGQADTSDPAEFVRLEWFSAAELSALVAGNEIVDPGLLLAWHTARAQGLLPS